MERRLVRAAAECCELLDVRRLAGRDLAEPHHVRVRLVERLPQRRERVIWKPLLYADRKSLNLSAIVEAQRDHGLASWLGVPWLTIFNWYRLPLLPMFLIFFVSALAETGRPSIWWNHAVSNVQAAALVR